MDMGMDVDWCLTCSKQTLDARTPYCSEQCRQGDLNVATPNAQTISSTTPSSSCVQLPKNPRRLTASRPPLAPVVPPVVVTPTSERVIRDRRAFSFPASQMLDSSSPKARRDSTLLPAFVRKPQATHYATTSNTTPVLAGLRKPSLRVPSGNGGLSKSSGATTPLALDSVFCSTSESSDNEGLGLGLKSKMGTGSTARPSATRASRAARPSLPAEFHKSPKPPSLSFIAKSPTYLSSKQYTQRKHSQSPVDSVAAAIASSSSSRSREDIMAWAKAVKSREGDAEVNDEEVRDRGRPRTRRKDSATNEPTIEEEPLSTTPKGPLQSVFAGLTIGRFGPIVKAFTSVTGTGSTAAPSNPPPSGALGLHSVPAPATVSRVDVTASSGHHVNDDNLLFFGGATPTLSTISFSEANEPTIATDNVDHEHVDMVTDDQHSAYSSHYRRGSTQARLTQQHAAMPKAKEAPTTQRPSALWNWSNYIRSFAPFSLPTPAPQSSKTSTAKTTPSTSTSTPADTEPISAAAAPVPASRVESPAQSPPKELVRSVPMDIIVPQAGPLGDEFRERQAYRAAQDEADRLARQRRSRSGRASRSRSRSRTRSRSRGRSRGREIAANAHARQWSYDADASDDDDDAAQVEGRGRTPHAEGRGRTPRAKILGGDDGLATGLAPPALPTQSQSRGRNDDVRQSRSRGQRAESPARGRGRDRGVRA